MTSRSSDGTERVWLPVCHDCKLGLTHPQANRDDAEAAARRHRDRLGHSTGVRRDA
jgi:hypothetical protein